jgi:DNA-binding MarR family transcriptional regulator
MKPLGLTKSQWRLLAYVSRNPGITGAQAARKLELSRMAITGLIDRMQAKGLVERRFVADDRRIKTIHLTRKSRELVSRMNETAERVLDAIFAGVSATDKSQFGKTLMQIKNNAYGSV